MNQSTRRNFLITTAAAVAGTGLPAIAADKSPGYIDAHVHVWTPDTDAYPLAEGFDKAKMKPASFTPDELFAECRPHGVERIVLIQMSYYRFDNSYMLKAMADHPGVFSGVAVIDETAPDLQAQITALKAKGVRGFRLYASAEKSADWQSSGAMRKMWTICAEQNLNQCLLSNPDALPTIQKMCREFPDTPVVIDHFSRIGVSGSVDQHDLDQLHKLADSKNVTVKLSAFYALGKKAAPHTDLAPMIRQLRDAYGADRLMWATDCPYQVQGEYSYGASIDLIRDPALLDFLTSQERKAILRSTAERVFFS